METRRYVNVAYKDREIARRLGGRWDPQVKRWYAPVGSDLAKVLSWRKPAAPAASPCNPMSGGGAHPRAARTAAAGEGFPSQSPAAAPHSPLGTGETP